MPTVGLAPPSVSPTGHPFVSPTGHQSCRGREKIDFAGEQHGFIGRDPKPKRGRQPSPRTGQVHAKVMPHVAEEIANEAKRRGVQQGVLLEEAWALYRIKSG
jgi:hypothetical protein